LLITGYTYVIIYTNIQALIFSHLFTIYLSIYMVGLLLYVIGGYIFKINNINIYKSLLLNAYAFTTSKDLLPLYIYPRLIISLKNLIHPLLPFPLLVVIF